jgi:hypothetical protein
MLSSMALALPLNCLQQRFQTGLVNAEQFSKHADIDDVGDQFCNFWIDLSSEELIGTGYETMSSRSRFLLWFHCSK